MNDLKWIEANLDEAKKMLGRRGHIPGLDRLMQLMKERRKLTSACDDLKQKRNEVNNQLKSASKDEIDRSRETMRELSNQIKDSDKILQDIETELSDLALVIPNIPKNSVPDGQSEKDNFVVKHVLEKPKFNFSPRDHVELGKITQTIDMARAAKISGARFAFLQGDGSKLNRALMQMFCDFHVNLGDTELTPPYLVREQAMIGAGQFPKFVDDTFKVMKDGDEPYYLIPTAEVPVTNYLADEIIDHGELPKRYCAYSACFRAEAGAAGKDTKGMIRLHQFEKVEMVRFVDPDNCMAELDLMVERASKLLSLLELPHRVVQLCVGDLGFHSEMTYDLEVFLPGQDCFREISSCSSFGSFQARRAKIRYKKGIDKPLPLATLNGSGLPLGRTIVAILENHQNADGSINIPQALQVYMGGQKIIKAYSL